ncbi:UNVERIFIED_CONTAM: hypothetical protein Scaly_2782200 [Sesamum calycinum]|uniref:Transposase n=1 Tax=Sesamum calycinum TaxID=2727403 RepID=A0AAW2IWV8_9LAMI
MSHSTEKTGRIGPKATESIEWCVDELTKFKDLSDVIFTTVLERFYNHRTETVFLLLDDENKLCCENVEGSCGFVDSSSKLQLQMGVNKILGENEAEMMHLLENINFDDDLNGGEGGEFQFQGEKEAGEGDLSMREKGRLVRGSGEDSDFENVPDEAGDAKKYCYYKDTTKTKDLELVVGMKFASGKIFRERMEGAIRDNPNIGIAQLKNTIMRKCRVDVSKSKIKRAKREALDAIRGVDDVQYNMLWDYCETVRVNNPGSKIILRRTEGSDVFGKLYYSLHAMKQGFVEGCRPIIGFDGCFLKTVFGGQMLVAVGRDANDNMWPIALAIVGGE